MNTFDLIAALIVLVALFSYVNAKLVKLPSAVGLMAMSLLFSGAIAIAGAYYPALARRAGEVVLQIDLNEALLHGMLGFLLFAGALHVNLSDLARHRWPVGALATFGVLFSTAAVAGMTWLLSLALGLGLRPIDCMLFGALISPTDPIAVLALLKQIGAPKALEVQIAGESLFNDGVGVVLFLGLLEFAGGAHSPGVAEFGLLFVREALGGAAFGLAVGWVAYLLLRSVDNYQVEIFLSLALVAGGYAGADALHLSGPIAMVVAGLLVGNHGRSFAMSELTTERLDQFWELIDEFLNASLFVLIGLEVLALKVTRLYLLAGLLAVPVVLAARAVSVAALARVLRGWGRFGSPARRILIWGGLRGGISVALALALPARLGPPGAPVRDVIVAITYVVVAFSILVQGLTIGPLSKRWLGARHAEAASISN